MDHSLPLFLYFRLFYIVQLADKILLVFGLELQISGVGSESSTNWATTTALVSGYFIGLIIYGCYKIMSERLPSIHVQDLIEVCAEFRLLLYASIDLNFAQQNQQACTNLLRLSQICGNKKQ